MKSRTRTAWLVTVALAAFYPTGRVHAQTVTPGGTIVFTQADGTSVTCRRLAAIDCIPLIVTGSADAAARFVEARSSVPVSGLGVPNYATATIYNDFFVAGGVDQVIDAQVDVTYDYFTSLNVAALSKVGAVLSLSIVDITYGTPGIPVAAADLVNQERSMDQGVTDVAQGTENSNLQGANGHFQAKLRRNHTYRLQFTLETVGEVSLLGVARMVGQASWSRLAVTIDEDEVELLGLHDAAIKGVIATHDTAIKARIATHDSDIKQLLAEHDHDIKQLLAEVIRLLNTPTGRRPEFPIK